MELRIHDEAGLSALRRSLAHWDRAVTVKLLLPDTTHNFHRSTPSAAKSYIAAARLVGADIVAVPRAYEAVHGCYVTTVKGAGFASDDTNPNPACLGLVMPAYGLKMPGVTASTIALGVPFADAPPAIVIHPPSGAIAAVSGHRKAKLLWLAQQTIEQMRRQVNIFGLDLAPEELWVVIGPGARMFPLVQESLRGHLVGAPRFYNDYIQDDTVNLSGLFAACWREAGLRGRQVIADERCTITETDGNGRHFLPSKQRASDLGETTYASGLMIAHIS